MITIHYLLTELTIKIFFGVKGNDLLSSYVNFNIIQLSFYLFIFQHFIYLHHVVTLHKVVVDGSTMSQKD